MEKSSNSTTELPKQKKNVELLQLQTNVQEPENNSESGRLIERERIENTPFTAVKDETGWFLTMGEYRITEHVNTKEEAIETLERNKWWILTNVVAVVIEKTEQFKTQNQK